MPTAITSSMPATEQYVKSVQNNQERHLERSQWYCSGVFIFKFEQISHINLVFPLLTLN